MLSLVSDLSRMKAKESRIEGVKATRPAGMKNFRFSFCYKGIVVFSSRAIVRIRALETMPVKIGEEIS